MRYSVYKGTLGGYRRGYDIYEGPPTLPIRTSAGRSLGGFSLGTSPEDVQESLPPGSVKIGESDKPEGKIVSEFYSLKSFLFHFAVLVAAGWFYKNFIQ